MMMGGLQGWVGPSWEVGGMGDGCRGVVRVQKVKFFYLYSPSRALQSCSHSCSLPVSLTSGTRSPSLSAMKGLFMGVASLRCWGGCE